ncbi:hypothetical protein [Streptomyces sp. NPDC008092]|uniref:hypothetical protein n=1 Tax=Streptomyces sp. NPDC008092 TaxID=3364808 RepID=UPI0036E49083
MSDALPEFLVNYLAKQDAQRVNAVNEFLGSLTERERALVKDAAVMGYICGMTHPKGAPYPGDGSAVVQVVEGCLALPHLYPAISTKREA